MTTEEESTQQRQSPLQEFIGRIASLVAGCVFIAMGGLFAYRESMGKVDPFPLMYRRHFLAVTSAFLISLALTKTKMPNGRWARYSMGDLLLFSGLIFVQIVVQQILANG